MNPRSRQPLILATALALLAVPVTARDAANPPPPVDPADVESIDAIMEAVYDVISGDAGEARDWDRFRSLFAAGAALSSVGRPGGTTDCPPGDHTQVRGSGAYGR